MSMYYIDKYITYHTPMWEVHNDMINYYEALHNIYLSFYNDIPLNDTEFCFFCINSTDPKKVQTNKLGFAELLNKLLYI